MQQHVLDDRVGALAVLHDLVEIALQHIGNLADLCPQSCCRGWLRLSASSQFVDRVSTETAEKLLTKLSGFLISCAMPAVSWPSAAIFCVWTRRSCAVCKSRNAASAASRAVRIASSACFRLGDVAVDQHEAATRHRIAAHLDDAAVGPRAFEAHFPPGIFDGAAQLRFEIGRDVLAARRRDSGNTRQSSAARRGRRRADRASPGNCGSTRQAALSASNMTTPSPILSKVTRKLGLAVAQLLEQSSILDRDHRLVGEAGG